MLNHRRLITLAMMLADEADRAETDAPRMTTEDDVMALLSRVELVERSATKLREALRATLEGKDISLPV